MYGVEIDTTATYHAARLLAYTDADIEQGDALDYQGYGDMDVIWLYRPFRDAGKERELEKLVIEAMKPGAILAGGSWETDPAELGWNPVVDDSLYDPQGGPGIIWRGAWRKPKA